MLSVGDAAARLGVSPSTLRMWGTRYGLLASETSVGGHRRYTEDDLARLERVHAAIIAGADPAAAALSVQTEAATAPRHGPGGPGGTGLAVPGAGRTARGLARAAYRLDEMGVEDLVVEDLHTNGTISTWEHVVRPVLIAAGTYWQRTGKGIEVEHLLSQAVTNAFVRHVVDLGERARVDPVLLASGPHEEHTLALHAVRSGLAERDVPARLLGPRTPMSALATAARRTRAPGVLVWLSAPDPVAAQELSLVTAAHRRLTVHLGGPGWESIDPGPARICADLSEAVQRLQDAWRADTTREGHAAGA
ncbi:MerR family transcriptional regulator [Lapillicoccus sp.]|uniref:MerR family transcriptional regulator n=1 Tax=Lapillicoccus sp. TaxID=1909287 RepID=UPI003263E071